LALKLSVLKEISVKSFMEAAKALYFVGFYAVSGKSVDGKGKNAKP
jgi:hypothetical protein